MYLYSIRIVAAASLLVGLSIAQGTPKESAQPTFRATTNLVTVPFQVRRGSRSVSDLKPSDVVLFEDGVPRGFTIFEAPPVRLTLDLVVMFDVTNPRESPETHMTALEGKGELGFGTPKPSETLPTTGAKR